MQLSVHCYICCVDGVTRPLHLTICIFCTGLPICFNRITQLGASRTH
eukprot:COSAG01_NODE_18934_length_1042_cov_201.196182_2_plen_46_part_01